MAVQSKPIIFKITEAGKQAALNGGSTALSLRLSHIAIGTSRYSATGSETALKAEAKRVNIVSGGVEVNSHTLRFSASITNDTQVGVYEVGLFTDAGVLFAIASSSTDPFFVVYPSITFVGAFGLSLGEVSASNVSVSTDPNGALAITIMENHLAAPDPHPQYEKQSDADSWRDDHLIVTKDPHPQYLNNARFNLLLQALIPMGYIHHTHSTANPKPLFDELMGIDTAWRRLTGKIIVATDPNEAAIKDHSTVLGQRGVTTLASTERPHTYPLHTTHIFERYDPDTAIETIWDVTSSKTTINEGAAVRFTVTANNLPDGQILNWSVKEGVLNSASNDITSPDKTDSGTVILKNGQAVIDFTTSADDNEVEPQKHVRLTVGAPASLSINVPINDAGKNETVVHITQSTTNGLVLDEYYKQQSGAYPSATDKVRFIVDAGVDIVAPDTATPAITDGANWPTGSQIIVENRGRILGRGGDGGNGAAMQRNDSYTRTGGIPDTHVPIKINATAGTNGGTAIKGSAKVDNYGTIAGGGGGGGGSGSYLAGFIGNWTAEHGADIYHTSVDSAGNDVNGYAGSGIGAGGAPFGDNGLVTFGLDWIKKAHPDVSASVDALVGAIRNIELDTGHQVDGVLLGSGNPVARRASIVEPHNDASTNSNLDYMGADIDVIRNKIGMNANRPLGFLRPISATYPEYYNPKYETERYRYYSSQPTTNYSLSGVQDIVGAPMSAMEQPTKATLTQKGLGGASSPESLALQGGVSTLDYFRGWKDASGGWVQQKNWLDYVRGGNGGNYGENGEDGRLDKILYNYSGQTLSDITLPIDFETHIELLEPAKGGLAGYIKEGSVTITNYGSGTTKGR